jgi:hypothetical protein
VDTNRARKQHSNPHPIKSLMSWVFLVGAQGLEPWTR